VKKSKPKADIRMHSKAADEEPTMRNIWDVGSSPPEESVKLLPAKDVDTSGATPSLALAVVL
jgi:hypothetical protein